MAENDLISKCALLCHLDMAIDCKDCPRNTNKDLYTCNMRTTSEGCTCSEVSQICCRITNFVSDVQPVKHGRWIHDKRTQWKCSECGNFLDFDGLNCGRGSAFYCPNCGARMGGDTE